MSERMTITLDISEHVLEQIRELNSGKYKPGSMFSLNLTSFLGERICACVRHEDEEAARAASGGGK